MSTEILFEIRGAVLAVTFNRPDKKNAMTAFMGRMLSEKLKALTDDRAVRAILLRGADSNFMDGHDMAPYVGDMNAVQEQVFQKVQFFYAAIRELQSMERPVIAALKGRVSGAGFSYMLAADLVIASEQTTFNADFIPVAMIPDGGVTFNLTRKAGLLRATEILMMSEDFDARQAQQWGVINRIVPEAQLEAEALAWAEKLASGPTRIMGATKRLLSRSFEQDLNAQLSVEATAWGVGTKTFDFREAMKALAQNRPAKFTGS